MTPLSPLYLCLLISWTSLDWRESEQVTLLTKAITWHGMLYVTVWALYIAWYMAWYMRVSTSGLGNYGLPPHIRSVKWHGMHALWLGIYRMVYSMLYGMVCVCLHFRVWPSMACSLLSDLCHCMVCSTAWCITCYMTRYKYVSTSVYKQRWLAATYRICVMEWHALWHGKAIEDGPISCWSRWQAHEVTYFLIQEKLKLASR